MTNTTQIHSPRHENCRRRSDNQCGYEVLNEPLLNKGTAFTERERNHFGLRGLLPARVDSLDEQLLRARENYDRKDDDLERYIFLAGLQDRNETLFYRLVLDNIEEMMPIVYTPTVGQACQQFGNIWRRARGMFVTPLDKGYVRDVLDNWHSDDVKVIVVTDGERILGLGDLGASGMGIPIGKLSLYTACAGIHPAQTLPVTLDVGTNNQSLRDDPLYLGIRRPRLRGQEYDELVEEFVLAASERWPGVLIQFEDFANINCFRLLEEYRDRTLMFNDDIQGTAAVVLAGLYSALRITGGTMAQQRILFLGAGGAGIGIGSLIVEAMVGEGAEREEARKHLWFVDSQGVVTNRRDHLAPHKVDFAHDMDPVPDLLAAVNEFKPTAIIGVSGRPATFTEDVVRAMGKHNERPIVFSLSNPTSKSECTAEQAYRWTDGRAVFASGSPFDPVELDGKTHVPGQGNNAYIFPGLGLGVVACGARRVTDRMFAAAAHTLSEQVTPEDLALGRVYPSLANIRAVSLEIATAVAQVAYDDGLAAVPQPEDLRSYIAQGVYEPEYKALV